MKKEKSVTSPNPRTFRDKVDNFFGITRNNSTFKVETIGGLTTFFAMMYIMLVNPSTTLGQGADPKLMGAVYIATALGAMIGTLLCALYAKMPFAQAPGMGLNAFFFVTFMVTAGPTLEAQTASFAKGLTVIFLSGILFMIISVTGLRKKIAESMPDNLKKAIPAGIGLFIAYLGFQNAKFITANPFVQVQLIDINIVKAAQEGKALELWYSSLSPFLIMLFALTALALMGRKKIKGAVIYTILGSTLLFYLFNIGNTPVFDGIKGSYEAYLPRNTFNNFGKYAVGKAFFGFKDVFMDPSGKVTFASVLSVFMLVATFLLVDMFDTLGTLQATATEAGLLDEKGLPIRLKQSLMADSIGTLSGSVLGVSSVTTYVESSAGIAVGAKTGFASLITAIGFFIAMFFSPIAAVIPAIATAPILVYVGVLMLKSFKFVDMTDLSEAIPAFLTLIMMPLTYSISNGIAIGLISYTLIKLVTFKFKKKDIIPAIIAALFLIRFLTITM